MSISSISKKYLQAITGLLLCGFLVSHLTGNLLIVAGPDIFNEYAHKLMSLGALLYLVEAVLVLIFFSHVFLAIRLTLENNKARGQRYYYKAKTGRGSSFASSSMMITGVIIFIFSVIHLMNFKYGTHYTTMVDGVKMRDLYRTVIEYFENPYYTAWYVFAMLAVGIHTSHGFWSAFQSLGINHPRYTPKIILISKLYGVFIGGGFAGLAIYCHLKGA